MCQRRWMDLLKNYDHEILYHQGKGNVIADVLSRKSTGVLVHLTTLKWKLFEEVRDLNMKFQRKGVFLANLRIQHALI